MSFLPYFMMIWPTYSAIIWWWLDEHTFDALLARLAYFGLVMGGTGVITIFVLDWWFLLKEYF